MATATTMEDARVAVAIAPTLENSAGDSSEPGDNPRKLAAAADSPFPRELSLLGSGARARALQRAHELQRVVHQLRTTGWRRYPPDAVLARTVVSVAGPIGAGKSSLCTALSVECTMGARVQCSVREEQRQDDMLADFIRDGPAHAAMFQCVMGRNALNRQIEARRESLEYGVLAVLERDWYENQIFARLNLRLGNITEEQFRYYLKISDTGGAEDTVLRARDAVMPRSGGSSSSALDSPDYTVYLHVSVGTAVMRKSARGVVAERAYQNTYLLALHDAYFACMLRSYCAAAGADAPSPWLAVPWERYASASSVLGMLEAHRSGRVQRPTVRRVDTATPPAREGNTAAAQRDTDLLLHCVGVATAEWNELFANTWHTSVLPAIKLGVPPYANPATVREFVRAAAARSGSAATRLTGLLTQPSVTLCWQSYGGGAVDACNECDGLVAIDGRVRVEHFRSIVCTLLARGQSVVLVGAPSLFDLDH